MKRLQYRHFACYQHRGFTLIELLIALTLTVLISAMAYRFLDAALRVYEQGDEATKSLAELEQTWLLMASDLASSVNRSAVKPATGVDLLADFADIRPGMMSQDLSTRLREGALLWFVRQAWVNPLHESRSELQRVMYRLDSQGRLFRDYWPERNQGLRDAPQGSFVLLADVQDVQLEFLASGQSPEPDNWIEQWPTAQILTPQAPQNPGQMDAPPLPLRLLPAAIRVSLRTASLGHVQRIFVLPGV